ncbi:hypothetical protein ACHAWT_003085 [Skeletonema menzelii]
MKSVSFGEDVTTLDDSALLGWDRKYESDSDDDDERVPQDQILSNLNAKYVEGSVGMVRGGKSVPSALRIIAGRRDGVLVINLSDGGSLYFYKIFKKPMRYIKEHFNETTARKGRRRLSRDNALQREKSIFLRNQHIRMSTIARSGESIFHREKRHGRDILDVAEEVRKKIEQVAVYTSTDDFVEPAEMPYLYIPASVPWRFKSVNGFRNNSFQIVVPPNTLGDLTKVDDRVKIMSYKEKVKNMRKITAIVDGEKVTFATVLRLGGSDDNDDDDDSDVGQYYDDDSASGQDSIASRWAASSKFNNGSRKYFQVFEFCCNNDELAVYAKASQSLGRILADNKYKNTAKAIVESNTRVRDAGQMEVAAQLRALERSKSVANLRNRRISSINQVEYRVFPLYAYPYTWMTKAELAIELPRTSKNFVDLRRNNADEIGSLRVEVLQCMGLPKMDKYSLTDAFCYIVCGSEVFVTDVIPDNLNPAWLPLTRRACIFPLKNGYSQVYVGVFDFDGETERDDFIGRVVIDTPQLQSGFSYDIILPLRDTSKTYYRKKLGCVRLRLELHWTAGERAALLSYIPKSPSVITRRMTTRQLEPTTTITCPDAKSFTSVALTIYGEDVPGKYSTHIKNATSREASLINKLMFYQAKTIAREIATWKNPLLSMYIFWAWIYMVVYNAIDNVPSFMLSLLLIVLIRNYVKYNVNSAVGSLCGHRTIRGMLGVLIFNRDDSNVQMSELQRGANRPFLERVLLSFFGLNDAAKKKKIWKNEHHSEFPLSSGLVYPKITSDEAAKSHVWDATKDLSDTMVRDGELKSVLDWDEEDDIDSSSDEEEWSFDNGIQGDLRQSVAKVKKKGLGIGILQSKLAGRNRSGSNSNGDITDSFRNISEDSLFGENPSIDCYSNIATLKKSIISSKMPVLPEQDMKQKTNSSSTVISQIEKMHAKASKYSLHLFDDRVFMVDDRAEAEKLLRINTTSNPIAKKMFPIMGAFLKLVEIEICAFRAVFNVIMWRDPFLSFLMTLVVFCLMVVLLVFPWRYLFFVVGLVGLGPQNYFLVDWFEAKRVAKQQKRGATKRSSLGSINSCRDLAESPLLFRNNMQMKPDGKHREVIVPSVPFRYNRFYDWPPDPASTTIKEGSYS